MTDAQLLERLTRRLLEYFAAIGAGPGHVFELRDINHQVMMNVFAASERDMLEAALDALVADGMLLRLSATGCSLTEQGVERVNSLRSTSARGAAPGPAPQRDDAVARGLAPTGRRRIPLVRPAR
jgi:hypothetical protein